MELEPSLNIWIEGAVEDWRQKVLPDIEAGITAQCAGQFINSQNDELGCNGTTEVWIKTVHGKFRFRFEISCSGERTNYLNLTNQLERRLH